jgi:hypothetical protein
VLTLRARGVVGAQICGTGGPFIGENLVRVKQGVRGPAHGHAVSAAVSPNGMWPTWHAWYAEWWGRAVHLGEGDGWAVATIGTLFV